MESLKRILSFAAATTLAVSTNSVFAANVVAPLTEFVANTAAKADEVNGNFNTLASAVNDVADSVADLVARIAQLENGSGVVEPNESVAGRCYKLTSINAEIKIESGTKNGYLFFDETGNGAFMSYLRTKAIPDSGEETLTTTGYNDYDITWTQDKSTVKTTRSSDENLEILTFTASSSRDVMFAADVEAVSPQGESELYILNEMDCDEAEADEATLAAGN